MGHTTSSLIALDPGIDSGAGYFVGGLLVQAWPLEVPGLTTFHLPVPPVAEVIVCELPRYSSKRDADPNDLIQLAARAGALVRWAAQDRAPQVRWPNPTTWKGGLDKTVSHRRIMLCLTASERQVVARDIDKLGKTIRHNVMDAVGVGLWGLGRLGPGVV